MEERLIELMQRYEKDVLRLCLVYLRDTQMAQDAVQETFLKVYKGLERFRGDSADRTWIMRIAINTCKDMRRAAWYRYVNRSVTPDMLPEPSQPSMEDNIAITLEIMRLPRKEMEALLLYYEQGMSMGEAAEALGVTESTVSKRLTRAREKLREALEGGEANG